MSRRLSYYFRQLPLFPFLLVIFFVLHGVTEHYPLVPATEAITLFFVYTAATIVICWLAWIFFRDWRKAALLTFLLFCFEFFFGSLYDGLKAQFPFSFVWNFRFLLPLSLVVFIVVIIFLKKSKSRFARLLFYLNSLLSLLCLIDLGVLVYKNVSKRSYSHNYPLDFRSCPECGNPDIYLVIADSYPGNQQLKDQIGFDNTGFEQDLIKRGFHIVDSSSSNYNFTAFSVASMLNMDYVRGTEGRMSNKEDIMACVEIIKNNNFLRFLRTRNYSFYNYSIFDFNKSLSLVDLSFFPRRIQLVTAGTFTSRMVRAITLNFAATYRIGSITRHLRMAIRRNNEKLYNRTWNRAEKQNKQPKFVYTHLMMPHYPYYFDSAGNPTPYTKLTSGYETDKNAFKQYLQYTNQKLLALVDQILENSQKPPVIILMGDHGFRENLTQAEKKYLYMNLNAVLIPGRNYTGFYKGQSNVNQLRILLNTQFRQELPLLKDSTIFIRE